jgi:hypothetical protein
MMAKGEFFFRPQDQKAQEEFFSYPRGKHDDIMDAIWIALDKSRPCKMKKWDADVKKTNKTKKLLDWMVN